MESETITIRSSVLPELMRKTLWKGTVVGGIGALALLFGGVFIPVEEMKVWGPLLFLFSLGLITCGLLPYRRLKRLEDKPSTITVEGEEWLHYVAGGKLQCSVPLASVERVVFVDEGVRYGIRVVLKDASKESELFFPYFSRRSFNALQVFFV